MVEGSARARLGRALNTRSTLSAQKLNLQVGDEVDVYRAPTNKDTSGWEGPAEVIDTSRASRGVVSVRQLTGQGGAAVPSQAASSLLVLVGVGRGSQWKYVY